MTAEEGVGTEARPVRPLLVIGGLTVLGALVFALFLHGEGRLIGSPLIPWPLLALAFFLFERRTVDVHFRGEAHSFSMSDIPIVVGVFYLPPHLLLLAQLLGTLPAFALSRRLPLVKTVFNSALYAFSAALVAAVVRAVPNVADMGLSSWIATLAALEVVSFLSAILIASMIASSTGAWPRNWATGLATSALVVFTNGCVGLLTARIIRLDALVMLLLVPPLVVLWLGYKAYAAQQQRQAALAKLNRAGHESASRLSVDELAPVVLGHACDLFASGYGELVLVDGARVRRWAMEDGTFSSGAGSTGEAEPSLLDALTTEGGLFSNAPAGTGALSRYLAVSDLGEASAAPLAKPHTGFLLVGNRSSGARARWEEEDIQLLGNLADHLSVLMTNARLVEQLQESLETSETANRELVRTISDKEAAEAQRRVLEGRLRQSHKMEAVGRLAGGIAHDFNNLLTIISGYAGLLLHQSGTNGAPKGVDEIVDATERGSRLVKQLLLFSKHEEAPSPEVLDLNQVVKDLESLLFMSSGARVQLAFDLDPRSPSVLMDRGRLDQVLLNLAVNASDAMPSGGTLKISTEEREGSAGEVCLRVSDTGEGMSAEVLERAFEPFFTTKGDGGGTGLGLASVYGIVEQAGGKIEVDSSPGSGTTFEIVLPSPSEQLEDSSREG